MSASNWFGRVFGTKGRDLLDYSQWTRYLVVRPIVVALPAGLATVIAVLALTFLGVSASWTYVGAALAFFCGLGIGGWAWLRSEGARGR